MGSDWRAQGGAACASPPCRSGSRWIWLLELAGARIQEATGSLFAGSGPLFREEVVMSGVVPQVAALMGPCAAGTAYIRGSPTSSRWSRNAGSMALAGRHPDEGGLGEDVTQEELGGSRIDTRVSGVADPEVGSDEECIDAISAISRLSAELQHAAAAARERPTPSTAWTTTCSTSCPTRRATRTTCTS